MGTVRQSRDRQQQETVLWLAGPRKGRVSSAQGCLGGMRTRTGRCGCCQTPGGREGEIPWPLLPSCPPLPLTGRTSREPVGRTSREPAPCHMGVCRAGKGHRMDLSSHRQAGAEGPLLESSLVQDAVWLLDGQCPLLTFLMSSERKHRTYFTDGGCFTHRGCFTVCDKGHAGC